MTRIISFALGNVWRWTSSKNRGTLLNYVKKLDINGVEMTFSSKKDLYSFSLSKSNRSWLEKLDYVTIHAPFRLVKESNNEEEIIKQLNMISTLYDEINAKNVIIHPDNLPPPQILEPYNFTISVENLPPKEDVSISDLRKILNKYPNMRLCLDVSHAYLWSKYETGRLIKAFKGKISQIHFSGTYRKKQHQSLRIVSKMFLSSIQPLKDITVPIVIEEEVEINSLQLIREEINYTKNLLDSLLF